MFTNMASKSQASDNKATKIFGATLRWKKKGKSQRERQQNAAASIRFGMPLNAPAPERPAFTPAKFFGNGSQTELF